MPPSMDDRLSSPSLAVEQPSSSPATPANRRGNRGGESAADGNISPTSSTLSSDSARASGVYRLNDPPRTTFRPSPGGPVRKVVLRSDPSLLTCFDPADKELYDLWAPKK